MELQGHHCPPCKHWDMGGRPQLALEFPTLPQQGQDPYSSPSPYESISLATLPLPPWKLQLWSETITATISAGKYSGLGGLLETEKPAVLLAC